MTLLENMKREQNYTLTENGALALSGTDNAMMDLFASAGALRTRDENEIRMMFARALIEDREAAVRLAFYTRDVRGGLGERRTGRIMLEYLAEHDPEAFRKNLSLIPEYGRWDDLVYLVEKAPEEIMSIIRRQLKEDLCNMAELKPVSLLAKWLPSVNTSSKNTVRKGRYIAEKLGMNEREYRKTLAALRHYINVVEVNMSARDYEGIIYPEVPSKAMNNYRAAFRRNDEERFTAFLAAVGNGEEKINSSVLYPYDIVEKYLYDTKEEDKVLEEQWNALPDYTEGEHRFLVMADVSGSMWGRPMATSVGLAIYFAERAKGPYANHFMTFSARPELVEIKGNTLLEKIRYVHNADWAMNTNLEAAFNLVLRTAVKYSVPKEEIPESIVIITDMEIDACTQGDRLFYDQMKDRYGSFGYEIPNVVFWNVNARKNTYHASFDRKGVQLASGQSPTVFRTLAKGVNLTPYEYMMSVLNGERYERITV